MQPLNSLSRESSACSRLAFLQVFEPLESYRPAFMLVTLACLSAAFYSLYFGADAIDSESVKSSVRQSRRIFWFAVIVFVISSLVPIFVPQQSHAMHHSAGHYH